jgi:hypothetical protein
MAGNPESNASLKARFSSLTTGAKALVFVAGAIVTIASAVGVIRGLLPEGGDPVATFQDVSAESATLSAYAAQFPDQEHAMAPLRLVAYRVAQAESAPVQQESDAQSSDPRLDDGSPLPPSTETGTSTGDHPPPPTNTMGDTTDTTPSDDEDDDLDATAASVHPLNEHQEALLDGVREQVLDHPRAGSPGVYYDMRGCLGAGGLDAERCALKTLSAQVGWRDGDGSAVALTRGEAAEKLLEILDGSQVRRTPAGKVEPLGALVNFKLFMDHCDGDRLHIVWTMGRLDAGGWQPADQDWLRRQHALWIDCNDHRKLVPEHFWVPMPKGQGPFYLKVSVYDGEPELDYHDKVKLPG